MKRSNLLLPIAKAVAYAAVLLVALHVFFLGPLKEQAVQMVRTKTKLC